MSEEKIAYEPHPVSPERKAELRGAGYKIIDAVFAPIEALLEDGPTVAEYVAAGYRAANYPPSGYASRSTPEEIEAAIAAQEPAPAGGEGQAGEGEGGEPPAEGTLSVGKGPGGKWYVKDGKERVSGPFETEEEAAAEKAVLEAPAVHNDND